MDPQAARARLLAQHEQIRSELPRCVELARQPDRGASRQAAFHEAIEQLRFDINLHNATETRDIANLLEGAAAWGAVLVERTVEEHLGAHAAFGPRWTARQRTSPAQMQDLADELDADMAAEERTFLRPMVLRDDVIARRRRKDSHE